MLKNIYREWNVNINDEFFVFFLIIFVKNIGYDFFLRFVIGKMF